jgi:DNA (cytosine-5)-methyltransferase 1
VKYLSTNSGIEAATVAWHPLGYEAVAYSEIDKFCCKVLQHHYSHTPNWGDMTKYKEWPDADVDVLVGGTPCQSFSVAGLRKGLDDPRGNLMLCFAAIAGRYSPKWVVWENVPGVLSSNGGRDFGTFLGIMGQLGYGFAYRVLDAQYFGVAQRRRRVFVVGCLGDWRGAAAVLFEQYSLSGDTPPRRETGKNAAGTIAARTRGGGGLGTDFECDGGTVAMCLNAGAMGRQDAESETLIAHALRGEGHDASEDGTGRGVPLMAQTITADMYRSGGATAGNNPGVRNCFTYGMTVRRITPRECERLQGFPDGYTAIPEAKDGPRYKALGNSMAVPVMAWIGRRILKVEAVAHVN